MKPFIGDILVLGIMQEHQGCWRFLRFGSWVCVPTRERGNEINVHRGEVIAGQIL